ncbi:hypothetical protein [Vibrio parahaemolyticus]|uniref:hypothetical protein n=2 Tax=Vibrio parahaemolyticus TaxID=670 RepID=UPI00235FABBA|nr:hypothetical protein [Vibrio parahaemolyticus]
MSLSLDDYKEALESSIPLACEMIGQEQLQRAIKSQLDNKKCQIVELEDARNFDISELLAIVSACVEVVNITQDITEAFNRTSSSEVSPAPKDKNNLIKDKVKKKARSLKHLHSAIEKLTDEELDALCEWVLDNEHS